jgi:ABC-type nitrate/sulfonate/bicarbonate transport system ATPase subunit
MILPPNLDALTREDMMSLILALWEQNQGCRNKFRD